MSSLDEDELSVESGALLTVGVLLSVVVDGEDFVVSAD